jgi:hypothetical protein
MTLAADPVRLFERHSLSACEMQEVAVVGVVTIETPAMLFIVFQHDIGVIVDFASSAIGLEIRVAERTREHSVGEWRRRYVDVFTRT